MDIGEIFSGKVGALLIRLGFSGNEFDQEEEFLFSDSKSGIQVIPWHISHEELVCHVCHSGKKLGEVHYELTEEIVWVLKSQKKVEKILPKLEEKKAEPLPKKKRDFSKISSPFTRLIMQERAEDEEEKRRMVSRCIAKSTARPKSKKVVKKKAAWRVRYEEEMELAASATPLATQHLGKVISFGKKRGKSGLQKKRENARRKKFLKKHLGITGKVSPAEYKMLRRAYMKQRREIIANAANILMQAWSRLPAPERLLIETPTEILEVEIQPFLVYISEETPLAGFSPEELYALQEELATA